MRIGLFTDSYFPAVNGITYVVDILRKNIEEQGHEAWVFAPEPRMRFWLHRREKHIVRFPALEGLFFDEQLTSFFFPSRQLKKITDLNLDAIIIFTPGQVGLMGAYAAAHNDILLAEQYSTDLVSYVKDYPGVMPGVIALVLSMPITLRARPRELLMLRRTIASQRDPELTRTQDSMKHILNMLHDRCQLLIAVSEKSAAQLRKHHGRTPIEVLPTGVDALSHSEKDRRNMRRHWKVADDDVVCLYVGRMAPEKNIELLLKAFSFSIKKHPNVKLVLVGGFSYAEELKKEVERLEIKDKVIFIGRQPRESLGPVYAAADIFCFPSTTDTQALVLNEAAHAGLPLLWCDPHVNMVAEHGVSGILSAATVANFSHSMNRLIKDSILRKKYGAAARHQAKSLTEKKQTKKLISLLKKYGR